MFKEPIVKWVFGAAILIFVVMVSIYIYQFGEIFPSSVTFTNSKELRGVYGVIGDFFGGILNPLLTFCGFGFLIYTINQNSKMLNQNEHMLVLANDQLENAEHQLEMTRKEMELSRSEMEGSKQALEMQAKILQDQAKTQELQRFESTFFNLLSVCQGIRSEMSYIGMNFPTARHKYVGSEVFSILFQKFIDDYLFDYEKDSYGDPKKTYLKEQARNLNGLKEEYKKFYLGSAGVELGRYVRIIYEILSMVDFSNIEKKYFYAGLLRAQLSRYELVILFYHSISKYDSEEILKLVKKYDLLQHLEQDKIPTEHLPFLEMFKP